MLNARRLVIAALLCLAQNAASLRAAPPEPKGDPAYWDGYHRAIVEMRNGKWSEARSTLDTLDKTFRGDGRILLTRAVTHTLAADYAAARDDLERVRLENTREPLLWKYVVDCMTNEATGDRGVQGPRSLPQPRATFSGIPGHMVQGGKDYPTSYGSFIVYDMAWPHYLALAENKPFDREAMQKTKIAAGRWYANRMLATADLSSRTFALARSLVAENKLLEAREITDLARAPYPFDADMAALSADIWLAAGRPEAARRDSTIALTIDTTIASAYANRAEAAAMLGDARRAHADLSVAEALGVDVTALAARITELLADADATVTTQALLAELDAAAAAGKCAVEPLLPLAMKLHRVSNATRLRYDEMYQDRIREFEFALRHNPNDVDARLNLVQYLLDEIDTRSESVEPRRGRIEYRSRQSREMELSRALFHADKALALDPRNARALVLKAAALGEMGQDDAAARLVSEAMTITGPTDAQAARLIAEFRRRQVARMFASAAALRTPTFSSTSHDEHRYDGVWRVTTTTRYEPSGSDLARAQALERAASQLIAETRDVMERAINASRGTLDGFLLQSAYEDWFGSRDNALALLRDAVTNYPTALRAHDALVNYLRFLGRADEALEAEAVALSHVHTSCAPLLTRAWRNVDRQGFGPIVEILQRARTLNPADVRATIYLAEAERDLRDKEKAASLYAVAAALETARLMLDEQGLAKSWPRRADDLAALMSSRIMLARAAQLMQDSNAQIVNYEAAITLAQRFPPDGRSTPMFGSVFLAAGGNTVPLPQTPNGATIASTALLEAGRWYQANNRPADAQRCFQASAGLGVHPRNDPLPGRNIPRPNVGTGRPDDNNFNDQPGQPAGESLIELAKIEIAKKNYKTAFDLLQRATQTNLTREQRGEINDLIHKIRPHLQR